MSQTNAGKEAPMAKQQRSVQLPEEVFRLLGEYERRFGVKFNRVCLAALLKFFFSEPSQATNRWVQLAVAVEKGEIPIGEVGLEAAKRTFQDAEADVRFWQHEENSGHAAEGSTNPLIYILKRAERSLRDWISVLEKDDDKIAALIQAWDAHIDHLRSSLRDYDPKWMGEDVLDAMPPKSVEPKTD